MTTQRTSHSRTKVSRVSKRKKTTTAALGVALALLFAQAGGQAQSTDPLPYARGFLVTGDFVIGGVDLHPDLNPPVNGLSTAEIHIGNIEPNTETGEAGNQIPANPDGSPADIVAAYLYWETVHPNAPPFDPDDNPSPATNVKFRGSSILPTATQSTTFSLADLTNLPQCWGAAGGSGASVTMFQADVLHLLPKLFDANNEWTGKYVVTDQALENYTQQAGVDAWPQKPGNQVYGPHTVTLPEALGGDQAIQSAGATLFLVYRRSAATEPLRKVVVFDGAVYKPTNVAMSQTLRGFYLSAGGASRLSFLVATGGNNQTETISFNGAPIITDPFPQTSPSSDRSWGFPSRQVTMPAVTNPVPNPNGYGQEAITSVANQNLNPDDCQMYGAIFFSTAVQDVDPNPDNNSLKGDGIPDGLEDSTSQLKDPPTTWAPTGDPLPNLNLMGAGSDQRDIFIEFNSMWAGQGTTYGNSQAPFPNSPTPSVTDAAGHHHIPTPEVLKMVGDAYAARGIRPHFDVGDIASYHALGVIQHTDWVDDYGQLITDFLGTTCLDDADEATDCYLIPSALARGGEILQEKACDPTHPACHFPAYPGTVHWKLGLQMHRDALVHDDGSELTLAQVIDSNNPDFFDWINGTHRRRFDRARKGIFHYVLNAHARGKPKSLPCLFNGNPAPYDLDANKDGTPEACTTPNPDFNPLEYHVPSSASGIADYPGGNALVTLGLWEEFVGRPFMRAATIFHEEGHNLFLSHGGLEPIWGNKAQNTATYIEPNCKPNYLSSMSYLYVAHGLFDDNDAMNIDYSGAFNTLPNMTGGLDETTTLADDPLTTTPSYQPAWFAPALQKGQQFLAPPLAVDLGVSPATRFCNGVKFIPASPPPPVYRVHASSTSDWIDWNGDNVENSANSQQNVNFDATAFKVQILSGPPRLLHGSNDWANIRLNQIGAAPTGLVAGSAENLSELGGNLAELGGNLAELGGNLSELGGNLAELGGNLAELGGNLTELGGNLSELGGNLAELGGNVEEINHQHAGELGKSRPSSVKATVINDSGSCPTSPFNADCHRVEVTFTAPPVGTFGQLLKGQVVNAYQVQRKRAGAPDSTFANVGTTGTNYFKDPIELANGVAYEYRVQGLAADGNSEWSVCPDEPQPCGARVTAVNDAPADNGVQVDYPAVVLVKGRHNELAPGVLNFTVDSDSPTAFTGRRVTQLVTPSGTLGTPVNLTNGTLTLNANGSFTYIPFKPSFVGTDSFVFKADDGLSGSSDPPPVALSGESGNVTITINVIKK